MNCPIIVLVGPTAVGKTALSLRLVQRFDCEIISMDSMQVYRHMDIGKRTCWQIFRDCQILMKTNQFCLAPVLSRNKIIRRGMLR
ncbi:MAG: hypothetical protein D3916_17050, partial [Candidatus Electrothrix sp. MAN1_4]|nr:hypothetical protein [Candidatus Electrothrix sp. MAN1_4]